MGFVSKGDLKEKYKEHFIKEIDVNYDFATLMTSSFDEPNLYEFKQDSYISDVMIEGDVYSLYKSEISLAQFGYVGMAPFVYYSYYLKKEIVENNTKNAKTLYYVD